jgi:hypothetical protein
MNLKAKFLRFGNLTEGTSARGAWRKQDLIVETIEQYPKQVCLVCWGDTIDAIANLEAGQIIQCGINIESREFNGKWYTDVRAFGLGLVSSAPQQAVVEQPTPTPTPATQPTYQQADFFTEQTDDLPF